MASPAVVSSIFQEIQSFSQNRRRDLHQLASALQSGDLSAAKQAFNELAALGKNGPYRNAEPFSNSSRAQAFEAVGQALQSGDLTGAQAAFAALQSTFKNGNNSTPASPGSPAVVVNVGGNQNSGAGNVSEIESIYQQLQAYRDTRKSDLTQLGSALQSGNATAAKQAYDALVAFGQSGPNANGQLFQRTDRAQAFSAIGTALQSGDLAGAQQAFTSLANSFEQNQHVPPPLPSPVAPNPEIVINVGGTDGQSASSTPEVVINIASGNSSGSGSPEEVQINVGGSNGSGGQVTIGVTPLQNNTGEHIAIQFSQQNNDYKVVLDLLNARSNGTAQTGAQASSLSLHA